MSKPNKYQKQLSEAVEATRNELLEGLKDAQAKRTTALSTRDHAAHDKWSAYKEMGRNEQVLTVASRVEEIAVRAQLLAGNLMIFANDSHSDSEKVQAAMAEAAAAIKNASITMNHLIQAVHNETPVMQERDKGLDVDNDSTAANDAVDKALSAVNLLQTQSLECSIIAATPLAGSVAQSFSVLGDQVGNLVTDTTQARDVARQEVAATTTLRNQTWKRFYKTIEPFERPLQARTGLLRSFKEIDKLANFGLEVFPSNQQPTPGNHSQRDQLGWVAGLRAKAVLPVETVDFYDPPFFCAVSEVDASTFKFSSGTKGVQPKPEQTPPPLGGRHVWKQLSAKIAPDKNAPSTSKIDSDSVQARVAQAAKHTKDVKDIVDTAVLHIAKAVADAQSRADSAMEALEKATAELAAAQAAEDAKNKDLAEAQQKQEAAKAAVESANKNPDDQKSLTKVLKALKDAEAETFAAAELQTVAKGIATAATAVLAKAEYDSNQATADLLTAGAGRWEPALADLDAAQTAFETAATQTANAHTAANKASDAEDAAHKAATNAEDAARAISASTGSSGKLEDKLNKAEQAAKKEAAAAEEAGLEAADAIDKLNQAAAGAAAAAQMVSQDVPATEASAELSGAVKKMIASAASVVQLTEEINNAAVLEKQLEILAVAGVYQAELLHDNKGAALNFGTSYCIFMKQDLKAGIPASPLAQLPRFSLPSQPILANYSQQALIQPTALRLLCGKDLGPDDPLLVAFTLPAVPPTEVSHRMVVIPSKLWENRQEDEEQLIERASPSDYVDLKFTLLAKLQPSAIQKAIITQFERDIKSLLPGEDHAVPLQAANEKVASLLKGLSDDGKLGSTALVYYSCVPCGTQNPVAAFGFYSDMCGDIITLNSDCYKIGVLAWQEHSDGPYVGALVGKSESIGTRLPYFYGSAPVDDPTATPPPAAATTA